MLSSLFPQEDGSISGDVGANGGFCFPGAWNSPITSPTDGIGPVRLDATVMQFASLVGTRLGKSPADVLKAISGALEDVYNEQNK
jgi:hypothetical protein